MEILGRRSDRLDSFSRGPDKLDGGSDDLDYRSDQPASNIEIDISSMESNSEVSKTPHSAADAGAKRPPCVTPVLEYIIGDTDSCHHTA